MGYKDSMQPRNESRTRVLHHLSLTEIPQTVEAIRTAAGIGNWQSAKAILLELLAEGKIKGMKTSSSWVFWLDKPEQGNGGGHGH